MMETTFIYGVMDPSTQQLRYIGKSNNPTKRHSGRMGFARADGPKTHQYAWIRSLLDRGIVPEVFVIEEVPQKEWKEAEIFWIGYFRAMGADLVNLAIGGGGANGRIMPNEERGRRRDSAQKTWATRRERYGGCGVANPEIRAANISASAKGRIPWNKGRACPGAGQNLAQHIKENGPWNRGYKENRQNVLENQRRGHLGKHQSAETIAKRAISIAEAAFRRGHEKNSDMARRGWITRKLRYGPSGGN